MASWLVRLPPEGAVRARALARDILLCTVLRKKLFCKVFCVLKQDSTLTVPVSTQLYKWVPADLMLGGNSAID